jgi:hypothetical protein
VRIWGAGERLLRGSAELHVIILTNKNNDSVMRYLLVLGNYRLR